MQLATWKNKQKYFQSSPSFSPKIGSTSYQYRLTSDVAKCLQQVQGLCKLAFSVTSHNALFSAQNAPYFC